MLRSVFGKVFSLFGAGGDKSNHTDHKDIKVEKESDVDPVLTPTLEITPAGDGGAVNNQSESENIVCEENSTSCKVPDEETVKPEIVEDKADIVKEVSEMQSIVEPTTMALDKNSNAVSDTQRRDSGQAIDEQFQEENQTKANLLSTEDSEMQEMECGVLPGLSDGNEEGDRKKRAGDGSRKEEEDEKKEEESKKQDRDPKDYLQHVAEMTAAGKLVPGKDLMYQIGYLPNPNGPAVEEAVISQYKIAATKQRKDWVREARYYAGILFSDSWIDKHIPFLDQKPGKQNRNRRKQRQNKGREEPVVMPGGMCQDVRLLENPDLEVRRENAASVLMSTEESREPEKPASDKIITESSPDVSEKLENFVTDYTSSVLQEAMKQAISEGLSESMIMEVIDDVTSGEITPQTPSRKKLAPVDLSRTPRERVDQLAIGFNYHADQLVKDSPRMEALLELSTPTKRRTRDQLAVGFNYHSDLIVKNSPQPKSTKSNSDETQQSDSAEKNNALKIDENQNTHKTTTDVTVVNGTPGKTSRNRDPASVIAMGFSYNSDPTITRCSDVLVQNGCQETEDDEVTVNGIAGLSLQDTEDEGSVPLSNLPAGSVW